MPFPDGRGRGDAPSVFYALGRTIPHNNTPEKMFSFFDEVQRVVADDAVGLIDLPKLEDNPLLDDQNPYQQKVAKYAEHLESIGVRSVKARHIFDGPDAEHKFDRMVMTEDQIKAYGALFGFEVAEYAEVSIQSEGVFDNVYYKFTHVPDSRIEDMEVDEFVNYARSIGLLEPGVDYNKFVHAWGLPLGVALKCMFEDNARDIPRMRNLYKQGKIGNVYAYREGDMLFWEFSERN